MWEHDAQLVAEELRRTLSHLPDPDAPIAREPPAIKVIDCVLSLRKNYKRVVVPRWQRYRSKHPTIASCADLRSAILAYPSTDEFIEIELQMKSPGKGRALLAVADYLIDIQKRFDGATEEERLREWALWTRPGDYFAMGVTGFALAGFQYLRILFGADTAKPDVHIIRFVSKIVGRHLAAIHALYILERAAEIGGQSLRRLDLLIWERMRAPRAVL